MAAVPIPVGAGTRVAAEEEGVAGAGEISPRGTQDEAWRSNGDIAHSLSACTSVTAPETYRTYAGVNRCGGFHPDYALTWNGGDAAYEVLVCFGCKEAKLYGPKTELLVDIAEDAIPKLEALLKKQQQVRPTGD